MADRHENARRQIEDAALRGPAHLEQRVREAIAEGRDVPEPLRALLEKVRHHAYKVTDDDFAPLRTRYSDDELFEAVVAGTLGAALVRVPSGMKAIGDA